MSLTDEAAAPKRTAFQALTVCDVRRETPDSVSVCFEVPDALKSLFVYRPGQYLTLRATIEGEDVRRSYSICSAPDEGELRVAVKRVDGGVFSKFVNTVLKPGDVLDVLPAMGHFTADSTTAPATHSVAFAAGSGITPVISILKHTLASDPQARFTLFYGNRTSGSVLFLEELAQLKDRYLGRLQLFHILSMEEDEFDLFNGRLDQAKCDHILDEVLPPAPDMRFFCCGPAGMMEAVERSLLARGVDPSRIMLERFGAPAAPTTAASAEKVQSAAGRMISIMIDGRRVKVPFDAEAGNILDSARAHGLPAPYACKGGVCATCRAQVVSGEVEMRVNYGLSQEEVDAGYVLTCQAFPVSDDVVVNYDQ